MSIQQISVFTQSKPGHLQRTLALFHENGINVRGLSCSDSGDYGIARFIVDKPTDAKLALENAGAASTLTPVLCFALQDTPGQLDTVIELLAQAGINIVYCYSLISTYVALRVDDECIATAEQILSNNGIQLLTQEAFTKAL